MKSLAFWRRALVRCPFDRPVFGLLLLCGNSSSAFRDHRIGLQPWVAAAARVVADTVTPDTVPNPLKLFRNDGYSVDTLVKTSPWDARGWKGRVVIGEYVTGTYCPGCQLHDWAFDGLRQRYPATAFIGLAYHGGPNYPIADPVDSIWERVMAWYGGTDRNGGGTLSHVIFPREKRGDQELWDDFINGHGGVQLVEDNQPQLFYADMVSRIDAALQTAPEAALHLHVRTQGGTVRTQVTVDSLSAAHQNVYVRIVLVEDTVHLTPVLPKGHRVRAEHIMVVRSAARTRLFPLGLPLHASHGRGTATYTFHVARAQQALLKNYTLGMKNYPADQLKNFITEREKVYFQGWHDLFPDRRNWMIDPTRLHVVAFVQDAKTGDILQAQMVPVPRGPHGERLTL